MRNTKKVVICVGNTIGIMPPEVKVNVYDQMMRVGGTDGAFVIVYWNGNKFGEACQNFYSKNPQLCGEFKGDSIDISTCTLVTPAGYRTHWTKPDEARGIFEGEIGAEIIDLVEKGNGVLVAGRLPGGAPLAPGPKLRRVSTAANIGAQLTLLPPPEKFVKGIDFASLRRYREANLRYRLGSPWGSKGELAALCEVDADGRPKPMLENRSVDIGPVTVPSPKLAHNGDGANGHAANGHKNGHSNGTNGHAAPALPDAVADGIEPETPSRKQQFGDIYVEATPVSFKTRIMDELDYVCDDYTRRDRTEITQRDDFLALRTVILELQVGVRAPRLRRLLRLRPRRVPLPRSLLLLRQHDDGARARHEREADQGELGGHALVRARGVAAPIRSARHGHRPLSLRGARRHNAARLGPITSAWSSRSSVL